MSSDLQIINNRGTSRSAACLLSAVCRQSAKEFPEQLGFYTVARLLLQVLFVSWDQIKVVLSNYVGFKARLDHPKTMLQDIAAKLKCSRDGLGLWLPWAPSGNFACRYHIDLVIDTFIYSKICKIFSKMRNV